MWIHLDDTEDGILMGPKPTGTRGLQMNFISSLNSILYNNINNNIIGLIIFLCKIGEIVASTPDQEYSVYCHHEIIIIYLENLL